MRKPRISVVVGLAVLWSLPASYARAHWCDDMWISSYNISVRPDSDTSPKALFVQNNMGYQLPSFKLTATSSSGGAVTLTPPTTLKMANTLLPGEKGIWKIASGTPAKIEDLTFSVAFGDDVAGWTNQDSCYPLSGTKPVMVVKNDGSLYPTTPTGVDSPKAAPSPCVGIVALGRSLQYPVIADFEDVNAGLDKLLQYYCAGRGSWGIDDAVTKSCCKDTSSTSCSTTKPSSYGAVSDYVHLWAAGEMAIRKGALGARLPVLRERLKCGVNDSDVGFAGFALFVLGYLGDDAAAKTFLQGKASAGGELGTIAKAALYLMGDSAQKADVQAGLQSSSVFAKVACAGALGIVDKDDSTVTSVLFPQVKWNNPSSASEDGKGMYAAHVLEIVAFNRRGWVAKGMADGPVTFYGETGAGSGGTTGGGGAAGSGGAGSGGSTGTIGSGGSTGTVGSGGATGNRDGGNGGLATGGRSGGSGGAAGSGGLPGSGGAQGVGGSANNGGQAAGGAKTEGSGGASGSGGSGVSGEGGGNGSGGSTTQGSSPESGGGSKTTGEQGEGSGCACNLGGQPAVPTPVWLALAGLGLVLARRRRR